MTSAEIWTIGGGFALASLGFISTVYSVSAFESGWTSKIGRLCGGAGLTGLTFMIIGVHAGGGTLGTLAPDVQSAYFLMILCCLVCSIVGIGMSFVPYKRTTPA